MERHVKHPFLPVIDSSSKILVLGSVPSLKSVENNFYYMHPQNRFWRVLSRLLNMDLTDKDKSQRERILLDCHIALYDSVEECDIDGSKDTAIKNVIPADIPALLQKSGITHIFCNGNASYKYLMQYHKSLEDMTTTLPSTSPAKASFSLEKLIEKWKIILDYLY